MEKNILSFFVGLLCFIGVQVFASSPASVFQDISSSSTFYDAVKYMKDSGIVQGYADGTFKENASINRAEFLKIVLGSQADFSFAAAEKCVQSKSMQATTNMDFNDVKFGDWFAPYVCYAKEKGIIQGYSDNTFRPSQLIIVPEMAKIVAKTQKFSLGAVQAGEEWYAPYIRVLILKKAMPATINNISHQLSRGEMAEVLFRVVEKIESKPAVSAESISVFLAPEVKAGEMGKVKDCNLLSQIFAKLPQEESRMYLNKTMDMAVPEAAPAAEAGAVEESTTSAQAADGVVSETPDFSETNVQVAGVDEADIVKNDAKYIYLIKGNTVRIVEAYPSTNIKETGKVKFENENFTPQEMFVTADKLVVIGNAWQNTSRPTPMPLMEKMMPSIWPGPMPSQNLTIVYVVNIADRSAPKVIRTVQYESSYVQSRRIGDKVYLVLNKQNRWYYPMYKEASSTSLIPQVSDSATDNGALKPACACGDIQYFPGFENPDYLIVSVLPINDTSKEITKEVFLGSAENIYMSPSSLYVSTGAQEPGEMYWSWNNTQVYKFAIDNMDIKHTGTVKVPGRILNQFAMDEFDDHFRIATIKDQDWSKEGDKSTSRLYVMDKDMNQVGALTDIAPGEQMHSVRFMGDRAFMVTFKQIDPLFVIGLKDPKKPTILGELKVPGYSDYLHPYDENHLIGFGKEVDASIDADKVHSDNAVYYTAVQGLKVSLFDVTDLKNPKEMSKIVIGDRGTESDILNNHKALMFDKTNGVLAFPINIQQKQDPKILQCTKNRFSTCPSSCERRCVPTKCTEDANGFAQCTSDCEGLGSCIDPSYEQFKTTFAGAIVLNVDLEKGLSERGRISHYDATEYNQPYFYEDWEKKVQRIIYIGKNLYTVSSKLIKVADKATVTETGKLTISE